MPETKPCPLCGGTMRLKEVESKVWVPGNASATARNVREWICPDCDYYEEADDDGTEP